MKNKNRDLILKQAPGFFPKVVIAVNSIQKRPADVLFWNIDLILNMSNKISY